MSACRLVATIVSSVSGLSVIRMVMASTSILSQVTSGNSLRHLGRDLVPHHHAVALGVGLGDHGQELARARAGELERVAHDPGHAGAGEDHHLGADLVRQPAVRAAALAGVLALRVLAHDHPVELLGRDLAQGAGDPGQDAGRADVGVLVERLADREPQAPQRDVVRHVGGADGAEVDRVEARAAGRGRRAASSRRAACSSPSPSRSAVTSSANPPSRPAQASSTSRPAAITSGPIPSPGIAAILWVRMRWSSRPKGPGSTTNRAARPMPVCMFLTCKLAHLVRRRLSIVIPAGG